MPKQPDCKWAQRPDKIMLTLNVSNVDPAKSDIKVCVEAESSKYNIIGEEIMIFTIHVQMPPRPCSFIVYGSI